MTITHPAADTHAAGTGIDTATNRTTQPSIEPAPNAAPEPSPRRGRSSVRLAVGWIAVVLAVAGLAVLTYRFVADDAAPAPSGPVGDPKDRIGYRSPTIQRDLTTGDAKDHATYRPALTSWDYTSGDAKDHAPYRPPLTTWEYTAGDAKDHAAYSSPYDTP
jgi:hypothetical protein